MRKIGQIEDVHHAERFGDYLYAEHIDHLFDNVEGGVIEVWIHDENVVDRALSALKRFKEAPDDPVFEAAKKSADQLRLEQRRQSGKTQKSTYDNQRVNRSGWNTGYSVTVFLILLSVVATVFGGLGADSPLTRWLSFTEYRFQEGRIFFDSSLPEIAKGQVWRLLTPVFLHSALTAGYGILHLLFNMLWLHDLGGMIEKAQGGRQLFVKVLLIGVFSNVVQYLVAGPAFGGMSGVVYGLLGYIWVKGKQDLTSGLYVGSQTMMMMTFWFFLCLSGFLGPIANAAHTAGLLSGLAWGWVAARRVNRIR